MPTTVTIPGIGDVDFPDSMSREDINAAAHRLYTEQPRGLNELADRIRAKHPGAYDDMDDAELTKRVLAKYPEYSDLAAPRLQQPVQVGTSNDVANARNQAAGGDSLTGYDTSAGSPDVPQGVGNALKYAAGSAAAVAGGIGAASVMPAMAGPAQPYLTGLAPGAGAKLASAASDLWSKVPGYAKAVILYKTLDELGLGAHKAKVKAYLGLGE